jgi:hypothetical protein
MSRTTVTITLSEESSAFIEKCRTSIPWFDQDEFFELAIGALAREFVQLDSQLATDSADELSSVAN